MEKIQLWSQAVKKKAELVRLTNDAFNQFPLMKVKKSCFGHKPQKN